MKLSIQPLDKWPGKATSPRKDSPFSSTWTQTQDLLEKELSHIRASNVIIHTMHSAEDVRLDGLLRSDSRAPSHPGVILTFSIPCPPDQANCEHCRIGSSRLLKDSKWQHPTKESGVYAPCADPNPVPIKMRYVCDNFTQWKENVRAIALGLEAQRKMDRYGLNQGAQYIGFRALPPAPAQQSLTPEMAAFVIAEYFAKTVGLDAVQSEPILASLSFAETCYRQAAKKFHPDAGGDAQDFAQLERAITVLREHSKQS
jgi:hypothetical protein